MSIEYNVPYGEWRSPITSEMVSQDAKGYDFLQINGEDVYWIEPRPQEGGRNVIIRYANGKKEVMTPQEYNVGSKVHEYGGIAYLVDQGTIYFINQKDQRLLRIDKDGEIKQLTDGSVRFGNLIKTAAGMVAIAEKHSESQVDNYLALINPSTGEHQVLASGHDFFSSPTLSPNGKKLAWLAWSHPNMPWDESQLWMADFTDGKLGKHQLIAGKKGESVMEPRWSADGTLYYLSDRTGWWNLYSQNTSESLLPIEAEFGKPFWRFGACSWGIDGHDLVATFQKDGQWNIVKISPEHDDGIEILPSKASNISSFQVNNGSAYFVANYPDDNTKILQLNLKTQNERILEGEPLDPVLAQSYCSIGQPITFPVHDGRLAHAFYYPPKNDFYQAPFGAKPPLLVRAHGGPTAQCLKNYSRNIQYWTSRGFAYLDVNYSGSTGYGRVFRDSLKGKWGVADREDCEAAALCLIDEGLVDPDKVVIHGSSAGGYTVLCAMAFGSLFAGGTSFYGVSDPILLAQETHKFEARYLDQLIGPLPECLDLYQERSPILHAGNIKAPILFFQGNEDKVVPVNQAVGLYRNIRDRLPDSDLVIFEGEGHGFRKAESIKDALDRELAFYRKLFRGKG